MACVNVRVSLSHSVGLTELLNINAGTDRGVLTVHSLCVCTVGLRPTTSVATIWQDEMSSSLSL